MNSRVNIDLGFQASVELSGGDELPKKFSGVAYSGGVVPHYANIGDVVIDLSTLKLPRKALFALINHDPNQRAGKLSLSLNNGSVCVEGDFIRTESGKQVALEFSDGAPWEFSVGFSGDIEVFKEPRNIIVNNQDVMVNGLVRNASVREVSFVPAGADPNTSAVAFSYLNQEVCTMSKSEEKIVDDKQDEKTAHDHHIIDGLNAKLSELQAQVDAERLKSNELQFKLDELNKSIRKEKLEKLELDLGIEFADDKKTAYLEMSDAVFNLISSDLVSVKSASSKKYDMYFGEIAKSGQTDSTIDLSRKLFEQVSGVK